VYVGARAVLLVSYGRRWRSERVQLRPRTREFSSKRDTKMHIDTRRLVADLAALAMEACALKALLGATWTRPMADEQRRLARLRRRTTELCVLRAFARGRWHVTSPLREGAYPGMKWDRDAWNAAVAERVAKDYVAAAAREEIAP
jgi:hypothetical protein